MKIMILLMSCNNPLYEKEELACRETFIKDAEEAGISYWFYKGLNDEHITQTIDYLTHTMYLNVPDDLGGTAAKTITAMEYSLVEEYDYLIKTNVSTYLNIKNIMETIGQFGESEDSRIYGARFIINKASMNVPFPRGHFAIYSRSMVSDMVNYGKRLLDKPGMPKTDDTLLCLASLYVIERTRNGKYVESIYEVPAVNRWVYGIQNEPEFREALAIRCKSEKVPEFTPDNIKRVHGILNGEILAGKTGYRKPYLFETKYGMQSYEQYNMFVKVEKMVQSENKK